jgi:diguanylate cyclase (GGDEF)-like protein/PAS domain S-box-containing protein
MAKTSNERSGRLAARAGALARATGSSAATSSEAGAAERGRRKRVRPGAAGKPGRALANIELLDQLGHGVWDSDLETGRVFFSRRWKSMLGYAEDEIGENRDEWASRVHPDDWPGVQAALDRHTSGATATYVAEYRLRCKDGSYRWIHDTGRVTARSADGRPARMVGTHTDINEKKLAEEALQRTNDMLAGISLIQAQFLTASESRQSFDRLLAELLRLSASEYGFIGEVLFDDGKPYLKTYAITNIAWNEQTRRFHDEHAPKGMEFRNLDTLFGAALRTQQTVIANSPATDPRRGGIPKGHPPLDAFMGIPFLHDGALVGMVGLANRPGGYSEAVEHELQPLVDTIRTLIVAYRAERRRRQAEEALIASAAENRKLATVASLTSNVVILTDALGRIEWVNEAFGRLTGYGLDEIRGRKPGELLQGTGTDARTISFMAERLARGEGFRDVEVVNYAKGGRPYWVSIEVQPVRSDTGEVERFVAIQTDITARREAEKALRMSEAKFSAAFHQSADHMSITRVADRTFVDVNEAFERLTGHRREDTVGRTVDELRLWDDPAELARARGELRRRGSLHDWPFRMRTATGETRECLMTASPVEVGGDACYVCTVRDVSERRRSEEATRRLNDELRTSVAQLEAINRDNELLGEMRDLLQTCNDVEEAYRVTGQFLPTLFAGASGALYMADASKTLLEAVCGWGEQHALEPMFEPEHCWALRRGRLYQVADAAHGLVCSHLAGAPAGGYVCVPLTAQGETLGLLHVQFGEASGLASLSVDRRRALAESVTEHISLALSNVRLRQNLRQQATRDPLTGLFNRRYLEESLERELRRCARRNRPLTLWMIDIDHFKRFNDLYGHEAGDRVLCAVAESLQGQVRFEDVVCRYGGEEFLVLLPEFALEGAASRAEAIRQSVELLTPHYREQALGRLSVSIGVAGCPDHGTTVAELIRSADQAMYQAKHAGRNRVQVAEALPGLLPLVGRRPPVEVPALAG